MPLSGDFAGLAKLIDKTRYAAPRIMTNATRELGEEAGEQYRADFSEQRDPWGEAWGANKSGKTPVGDITGAMANPQVTHAAGVVRIRPVRYWVYFQTGANGAAKRAVLPFGSNIGQWEPPMIERLEKVVEKHFGVTRGR